METTKGTMATFEKHKHFNSTAWTVKALKSFKTARSQIQGQRLQERVVKLGAVQSVAAMEQVKMLIKPPQNVSVIFRSTRKLQLALFF